MIKNYFSIIVGLIVFIGNPAYGQTYALETTVPPARAEEAVTWESKGTVTFVEGFFSAFKDLPQGEELEVEIEEAVEAPGMYRLVNPYAGWSAIEDGKVEYDAEHNYYIILHAEDPDWVWAEGGDLGVSFSGMMSKLHSNVHTLILMYGLDTVKSQLSAAGGEFVNGIITFPVSFKNGYDTYTFAVTAQGVQWPANSEDRVKIKFPGAVEPDYSLDVKVNECVDPDGEIDLEVNAGEDIAGIRFRIEPEKRIGQGSYFTETEENGEPMNSGDRISMAPADGQDVYTVSVVGLNSSGKRKAQWLTWVFVNREDGGNWRTLGEGTFKDGFLPIFNYCEDGAEYAVTVEENADRPGCFRIVNPFENNPVAMERGMCCNAGHDHYMYIDATDPQAVSVKLSNSGLDMGDGMITLWSVIDANGLPAETLKAYGYQIATYNEDSRVIAFPPTSLLASAGRINYHESFHNQTEGKLLLPDTTGVAAITDSEEPEVWYDLTGIKVENPGKGVFIVRKGGSSRVVTR